TTKRVLARHVCPPIFATTVVILLMHSSGDRPCTYRGRLFRLLSHHKRLQCQPIRILLRGKLLGPAVMGIATGLFGEWMFDQLALKEASHSHTLDQLEIQARLLLVPGRASG